MQLKNILLSIIVCVCIFEGISQAKTETDIQFQNVPDWVIDRQVHVPEILPLDSIEGGIYYLLVDSQIRVSDVSSPEFYSRNAELIVNQQGLERSSQINIEFDPAYEAVVFNSLTIRRNGKLINKSSSARILVLQRETDLEKSLYDGQLTANVLLDDVRVGDVVDYSYTRTGINPVYNNIFAYRRYIEWSVPLHQQRIRLLWGKSSQLSVSLLNSDVDIKQGQLGRYREYTVAVNDAKPIITNSEKPGWYKPYGIVFFSETENWSEVSLWALPLYQRAVETGPGVRDVADKISSQYTNKSEQIVQALNFVQSEIRYLGIEMGSNSHAPSAAEETLQRRYGDCKDKAVLFISLLERLGVKASPALVNTGSTAKIAEYPPIVNAFDHVLVKVLHNGETLWLDPTRTYQKGDLSGIYQPDYKYALVVSKDTDSLERMNDNADNSRQIIKERFDLTKGGGNQVVLEATTQYIGLEAEKLRYRIADYGLTGLGDSYLEFYRDYYSTVETKEKLQIIEDSSTGHIKQKEKYLLDKFWYENTEQKQFEVSFYANSITQYLNKPEQTKRNSPYLISYPVNLQHEIDVEFGESGWSFEDEESIEDNRFFRYEYKTHYNDENRTLNIKYSYTSLTDSVSVNDIDAYIEAITRAKKTTKFEMVEYFKSPSAEVNGEVDPESGSNIFYMIIGSYIIVMLIVFLNWRIDSGKRTVNEDEEFYPVSLIKIYMLSIVTFGLYSVYWFYRNWLYVKTKDNNTSMPVARAIFDYVWYYAFYKYLFKDSISRYKSNHVLYQPLAILFAILFFLSAFAGNVDSLWLPAILVAPLLLLPLANYINHINKECSAAYVYNSRWLLRHSVMALLFLPLTGFIYASDINLLPNEKVVNGDKLWIHDLKFMHNKGMFPVDEEVIMFYSDAIFSIREDGNGFTEKHVFSYWVDDNTGFELESEELRQIKKIDVMYAKVSGVNTVVTITREDDSNFVLYVSRESGLDKKFVSELEGNWNKARPEL